MPPSQVVSIVRDAMENALEQHRTQAGEASDLVTGVTVNLSRKNIQTLPDEVVDIIKTELERYARSVSCFRHNNGGSTRSLYNQATRRKMPRVIFHADRFDNDFRLALSHNSLSSLPTRFSECTSLRYLNVRYNQIREFPLPVRLTPSHPLTPTFHAPFQGAD